MSLDCSSFLLPNISKNIPRKHTKQAEMTPEMIYSIASGLNVEGPGAVHQDSSYKTGQDLNLLHSITFLHTPY